MGCRGSLERSDELKLLSSLDSAYIHRGGGIAMKIQTLSLEGSWTVTNGVGLIPRAATGRPRRRGRTTMDSSSSRRLGRNPQFDEFKAVNLGPRPHRGRYLPDTPAKGLPGGQSSDVRVGPLPPSTGDQSAAHHWNRWRQNCRLQWQGLYSARTGASARIMWDTLGRLEENTQDGNVEGRTASL